MLVIYAEGGKVCFIYLPEISSASDRCYYTQSNVSRGATFITVQF